MTIGILLLAAGTSARFGSDKRLSRLGNGDQLLYATIGAISRSGLPLIVCLRHSDHELATTLGNRQINCIKCPNSDKGMGHSLADGAFALPGSWSGVLICLGDMPMIQTDTYCRLATAMGAGTIVVPVFNEKGGHPVGFDREFYPSLRQLLGDRGATAVLAANANAVVSVLVYDPGIHQDVDTPAELAALHL